MQHTAEGAKDLRSIQSPGSEEVCRLKYPQICLQLFALEGLSHTQHKKHCDYVISIWKARRLRLRDDKWLAWTKTRQRRQMAGLHLLTLLQILFLEDSLTPFYNPMGQFSASHHSCSIVCVLICFWTTEEYLHISCPFTPSYLRMYFLIIRILLKLKGG